MLPAVIAVFIYIMNGPGEKVRDPGSHSPEQRLQSRYGQAGSIPVLVKLGSRPSGGAI